MKRWNRGWFVFGLFFLTIHQGRAQSDTLWQQASRQFTLKAYRRAIELYTDLLGRPSASLTDQQRTTAQANLAYAYRQSGDLPRAEQTYQTLVSATELTGEQVESYREYAQTLASVGKYNESQRMYEKYNALKTKEATIKAAPPALAPSSRKTATRYRLEVLALNSSNAEFSPMYYGDGLVFVAGKKGAATIETLGSGGGNSYLDLFYVPNRQRLKVSRVIQADGTVTKPASAGSREPRKLGRDAYTRSTANDSRTPSTYQEGIRISGGLGYSASGSVQPFSRTLNSRYHEGPVTFSGDGSRLIFTRNNYDGRRVRQSAEGVTNLKLYTATQQNGTWTNIEELPFNHDDYSVGHPALSRDERFLIFASDMPGGYGGTDLYVARFDNGKWAKPVNLGKQINTKANELFPYVDERGNLYFSSDGHRGLGGLDIFFATLINGLPVGSIEHLDAPINSDLDDFGIVTDATRKSGYFSTNRQKGDDDIFRFVREGSLYNCRNLTLRVYDEVTNEPLDSVVVDIRARLEGRKDQTTVTRAGGLAQLCLEVDNNFLFRASKDGYVTSQVGFSTQALTDDSPSRLEIALSKPRRVVDTVLVQMPLDDGWGSIDPQRSRVRGIVQSEKSHQPLAEVTVQLSNECDGSSQQVVTGADGRYEFELANGCTYVLTASAERYGTNTRRIQKLPEKATATVLSTDLAMLRVGDIIQLDSLAYDLDQWTIGPATTNNGLNRLVSLLQKYPLLSIEVRSHTDSRGDAAQNRLLSAQRASSVVNYLASRGINRKRMIAAGYGESLLINACRDGVDCSEAEHLQNRRTEFKVLSIR